MIASNALGYLRLHDSIWEIGQVGELISRAGPAYCTHLTAAAERSAVMTVSDDQQGVDRIFRRVEGAHDADDARTGSATAGDAKRRRRPARARQAAAD